MEKVCILGAGSWGTTLAIILSRKKNLKISLFSFFPHQIKDISEKRENKDFLPGIKIPSNIYLTFKLGDISSSDILILAIPVKFLRESLSKIRRSGLPLENKIILSLAKGIDEKILKLPSQLIYEELRVNKIAVFSGPTIAREVIKGWPTVASIASRKKDILVRLQEVFSQTPLRVYRNDDVIGTELGGALKNIIAIACGISDGLGFGTNTKASLICRGLREITRFARVLGAKEKTLRGASGLGDLVTTCFSPFSRNRLVGERIGRGEKLSQILARMKMVAEGVTTVKAVYRLSQKYKIEMPITREVFFVLYRKKSPFKAVKDLMARPLRGE